MSTMIVEAHAGGDGQDNPGESEVDRLFEEVGAAFAEMARSTAADFLSTHVAEEPTGTAGRPILEVVAGHEMLVSLSRALLLAPQSPMTARLYGLTVRLQGEFTQSVQRMFPEDPTQEKQLGDLVGLLRALFHPSPRR